MALEQFVAWVHSGAGDAEHKELIDLPDNLYVAFYVPPGRQLGQDYGAYVFDKLVLAPPAKTLAEIKNFHAVLRSQIKSVLKPNGKTPASSFELHPNLSLRDWPRILGKGCVEDTSYLMNYFMFGAKGGDDDYVKNNMGIYHLGSGLLKSFGRENDETNLRKVLRIIGNKVRNRKAILHFLGCREQKLEMFDTPEPFPAGFKEMRRQIRMK